MSVNQANDIKQRILYADQLSSIAQSDLVIEAIIENLDVKKKLFISIEKSFI